MEQNTINIEPDEEAAPPKAAAQANDPPENTHKRSFGLRAFDVGLYPLITNIGVFVISVGATYLTAKGGDKDAAGKLIHGKTGEFFQKRGDWLVSKFKNMGMSHQSADMSKMVFFSFLDGSLMAPLVKMFEDRREKIGRWIDKKCGTTPSDPEVYSQEPKQSWGSVLGGRAATAAIVVPTAVALTKTGLNDTLFIKPGIKMGEWLKTKPKVAKMFGKYDVGELSKISIFEAFYTSVCTAGLYFSSRFLARGINKHKERKELAEEQNIQQPRTESAKDAYSLASNGETSPATTRASDDLRSKRNVTTPKSHSERALSHTQDVSLSF